jgi:hypothetical protein
MRVPLIAAALAASFALAFVPIPAVRAALPQLALACSSAPAGQNVNCTISRLSGGQGVYVLFQTSDGTAHAGVDYAATKQLVYLKGSVNSAAVAVPTFPNPNGATGTLSFTAAITAGSVVVKASGSIVEPAPAPVPVPTPAPPPVTPPSSDPPLIAGVTQACWNGWVISVSATCPAFPSGARMTVIAAEQAVPKDAAALGFTYGEGNYRTVQAGETVIVAANEPDIGCACAGQRRAAVVYGTDGKYIGELWADNLR